MKTPLSARAENIITSIAYELKLAHHDGAGWKIDYDEIKERIKCGQINLRKRRNCGKLTVSEIERFCGISQPEDNDQAKELDGRKIEEIEKEIAAKHLEIVELRKLRDAIKRPKETEYKSMLARKRKVRKAMLKDYLAGKSQAECGRIHGIKHNADSHICKGWRENFREHYQKYLSYSDGWARCLRENPPEGWQSL